MLWCLTRYCQPVHSQAVVNAIPAVPAADKAASQSLPCDLHLDTPVLNPDTLVTAPHNGSTIQLYGGLVWMLQTHLCMPGLDCAQDDRSSHCYVLVLRSKQSTLQSPAPVNPAASILQHNNCANINARALNVTFSST